MPGVKLISYDLWKRGTARRLLPRSKELRAVDAALKKYTEVCGSWNASSASNSAYHDDVAKAFNAWKASKGPGDAWKATRRDGQKLFTLLDNQLSGIGDTDRALGVVDFMSADMVHARLGAVYLFSHLDCDDSMFSVALNGALDLATSSLDYADVDYDKDRLKRGGQVLDLVGQKAEAAILARDGKERSFTSAQVLQSVPPPLDERLRQLWTTIRDKVLEYANKIIEAIKTKLDSIQQQVNTMRANPGQAVMDNIGPVLRKLVDALTSRFLADAAPFIGAGLDLAKGIVNTLDAGVVKFREWLASRDVVLSSGHITVIVESIKRAMWMSVGAGLYDLLKGSLKLGGEFMSAGAAAIVSLITAIIEAVVKTVWKLIEISRLRSFFKESRELWETRGDADALHKRPIAFNQWFKGYSLSLPVLSVLALNTGITGNKMLFLKMYQSDNQVVSQSQFNAGVSYLDGLKDWGSGYLNDCGFSFSSGDSMVSGLLAMAKGQSAPLSANEKVAKGIKDFLNA